MRSKCHLTLKGVVFIVFFVFIFTVFVSNASYSDNLKKVVLTGKQVEGTLGHMPEISGGVLVVKKKAVVVSFTKRAPSFCIFKKYSQQPVVCNYNNNFIGYSLKQGKYWVLPNIGKYKRYGWVSVTVKCSDCYIEKRK